MCGIVGIVSQNPVNESIYAALTLLQHRGQAVSYTHLTLPTNREV